MGLGTGLHHLLNHPRFPVLEMIGFFMPGEVFPAFFEMEMLQRALIAAILVTRVVPLRWAISVGVFLDKTNNKVGIRGWRKINLREARGNTCFWPSNC